MSKRNIFTVGFELPGDGFEHIEFTSKQTLLDADIILVTPTLGNMFSLETYDGKPLLTEDSSFATKEHLDHWRSEIVAAFNAGKLIIVYLSEPIEGYRYTGRKEHSGTGRSRVTTNIVVGISSYEGIPNLNRVTAKSGKEIRLEGDAAYLKPYWTEFSSYSPYEVEIEGDFTRVLLKSRAGNRTVGAAIKGKGTLLFLPPLQLDQRKVLRQGPRSEKTQWTDEAEKFGKRLALALVALSATLNRSTLATPTPNWALESRYRLKEENQLETAISACTVEISQLQAKKALLESELAEAGSLRNLLYEQGPALEQSLLEALRLFGFEAKPFANAESEFDAVFVSPEGRCLGEAEGKDNRPINIDKFSQLERNLQEDFAQEDVETFAKGVLFGNAYRLQQIEARPDYFTEKCVSAAKRISAALVRTSDLFGPAKYLKENPSDVAYAKACREAIFSTQGTIVLFPLPPIADTSALVEAVSTEKVRPNIEIAAQKHSDGGVEMS